jgi:hypothetical protein
MQGYNKAKKEEGSGKNEFYHDQYYALHIKNDTGIS